MSDLDDCFWSVSDNGGHDILTYTMKGVDERISKDPMDLLVGVNFHTNTHKQRDFIISLVSNHEEELKGYE